MKQIQYEMNFKRKKATHIHTTSNDLKGKKIIWLKEKQENEKKFKENEINYKYK